jgi:hypothetical protein
MVSTVSPKINYFLSAFLFSYLCNTSTRLMMPSGKLFESQLPNLAIEFENEEFSNDVTAEE